MNRRSFFRSMLGLPLLPFVPIPQEKKPGLVFDDSNIGWYCDPDMQIKLAVDGFTYIPLHLDSRNKACWTLYTDQGWRKVALA